MVRFFAPEVFYAEFRVRPKKGIQSLEEVWLTATISANNDGSIIDWGCYVF